MKYTNCQLTGSIRAVDEEKLIIEHIINTKALDRYLTVVLPKGAIVENFLKNPIVLFQHNGREMPIARCVELSIEEDFIKAKTQFNGKDELAIKVFNAFKDGYMNGWSIGFIPMKAKQLVVEDLKTYSINLTEEVLAETPEAQLIYEWELLEYSAVSIPANPEALKELVARGFSMEEIQTEEKTVSTEVAVIKEAVPCEEELKEEEKKEEQPVEEKPQEEQPVEEEKVEFVSKEEFLQLSSKVSLLVDAVAKLQEVITKSITDLETKLLGLESKSTEEVEEAKKALNEIKKELATDNVEKIRLFKGSDTHKEVEKGFWKNYLESK